MAFSDIRWFGGFQNQTEWLILCDKSIKYLYFPPCIILFEYNKKSSLNHLLRYTNPAATIMWILVTVSAIDPGLVWSAPCLLTRPHSTAWLRRLRSSFLQHQFIAEAGTPDEATHCHHYYVYFRHSNLDNGSLHPDKGPHGGMSAHPTTLQCLAPPWLRSSAVQHQICD